MLAAGSDVDEVAQALEGLRAEGRRLPVSVLRTPEDADRLLAVVDSLARVFSSEVQLSLTRAGMPLDDHAQATLTHAAAGGAGTPTDMPPRR